MPLPMLLTSILGIVAYFFFVSDNSDDENRSMTTDQIRRCLALVLSQITDDDDEKDNESTDSAITHRSKRRKYIRYDRERTMKCLQEDYLGPTPRFDDQQFQRVFRISKHVYNRVKEEIRGDPFFSIAERDATGQKTICIDAKLLIALKHLAYGCATNSWTDYFQMGESTARLCVERFCFCVSTNSNLRSIFLRPYNKEDATRVSALHEVKYGIPGMLGSLDCMHVRWKNCPVAYQGTYKGKEKYCSIVLEAVADHNLWFWHAAFGFAGSCNDINILDASPLHQRFVDGTHSLIDFPYNIGETQFNKLFYLVDGIYPLLSRFVKTISVPINKAETNFSGWQESSRKDVERAFGVLQAKWRLLSSPVEKWDERKIQHMVMTCLILHNMMVDKRISESSDIIDVNEYFNIEDRAQVDDDGVVVDDAEQEVRTLEAELAHVVLRNQVSQFQQDRLDFWQHQNMVIQSRWGKLYDDKEHIRLRDAIVKQLWERRRIYLGEEGEESTT